MSVPKDTSTKGLLVAGAGSYPEALAAISEFRREIQTIFRESLSNDLAGLAKAMAIKMALYLVRFILTGPISGLES